ncbi:NADP-specific glutamate dehydrogenase [Candidatus Riesia pediculischaeffi]|uniref:Glutamate dehydrogenase n=2 Tax=Candidatus Riesia pediculischaeffi TaxID=428411 RepID=A0A1V0HK81_9ENTR|nr:NADP-specific glutamate dehydrogenase [Candidatus Riesia pediculischaeffi]ARC53152.1 glutamate dehydrogenase [Candidatus Riesia pediculischaeffi]KIE64219.1 NADP-specific glutamate dehydrogenase [Candidatus Riesia pediculischaeffi PTSU]
MKDFLLSNFLNSFSVKYKYQPEFHQSVKKFLLSISSFLQDNSQYQDVSLLTRLTEPERIIQFRICWMDDLGDIQVNTGWRVQFNSAIGPFKGGIRFHQSVNTSILKFLAFEQTFKNALTNFPIGGGKGGSDFNPKGKSKMEITRFCQSFVLNLYKYLGTNVDIPAGDIGVSHFEIDLMVGMMKKILGDSSCVFTGKGLSIFGSQLRKESTGYGVIYFTELVLNYHNRSIKGKKISISGSGNVAIYAIEKCIEFGAKVITASDSNGTVVDLDGFNLEKLNRLKTIKNEIRGRIQQYASELNLTYLKNQSPWSIPSDIAIPCATQNEIDEIDAKLMIKNDVQMIVEGSNMPVTEKAIHLFELANILFIPGKIANSGGVIVSILEKVQNSTYSVWKRNKVEKKLKEVIKNTHKMCVEYGKKKSTVDYVKGANIAAFVKVAEAMISQGMIN